MSESESVPSVANTSDKHATSNNNISDKHALLQRARYLVISGGGIKGIAYCGALKGLCDMHREMTYSSSTEQSQEQQQKQQCPLQRPKTEFFAQLDGAIGTSIGSLLALCCVCQVPIEEMCAFFRSPQVWDRYSLLRSIDLLRAPSKGGIFTTKVLYEAVFQVMEQLCHLPAHITMEGLYQKTGKWFECNTVCVEEDRHVFINHETWPGLCVADALVMSMCLPVLFQPVNIKGKLYVDGGLHQNLLINRYPIEQTIAIATAPPHRPTGLEDENTEQCAAAQSTDSMLDPVAWTLQLYQSTSRRLEHVFWQFLDALDPRYRESTIFVFARAGIFSFLVNNNTQIDKLFETGEKSSKLWMHGADIMAKSFQYLAAVQIQNCIRSMVKELQLQQLQQEDNEQPKVDNFDQKDEQQEVETNDNIDDQVDDYSKQEQENKDQLLEEYETN